MKTLTANRSNAERWAENTSRSLRKQYVQLIKGPSSRAEDRLQRVAGVGYVNWRRRGVSQSAHRLVFGESLADPLPENVSTHLPYADHHPIVKYLSSYSLFPQQQRRDHTNNAHLSAHCMESYSCTATRSHCSVSSTVRDRYHSYADVDGLSGHFWLGHGSGK